MKKHEIAYVLINNLVLDFQNPRFAELYDGSNDQDELTEYLLYSEFADELAKEIVEVGEFYPDRPLWVLSRDDGTFLVKDGNRRCAAVKALQMPTKYGLNLSRTSIDALPVVVYGDEGELDARIVREHTSSLFREWDRIAKALEVYKMRTSGRSLESMKDIDSNPSDLIKLASFYYEAVKIGGDSLRRLLRRGRGKTGGKTIIFERLFKQSSKAGYTFKPKPSYEIIITDDELFQEYVLALIKYLQANPGTTWQNVDGAAGASFMNELSSYGFQPVEPSVHSDSAADIKKTEEPVGNAASTPPLKSVPTKRSSVKKRPSYERKQVPRPLDRLIKECYDLDDVSFPNAKMALVRVTFECTLKYVVENTEYKPGRLLSSAQYFRLAFFDRHGNPRTYTDFDHLKEKFTALIANTGKRKAFENFHLDRPHQIIHNYNVGAIPIDAVAMCDNLVPLLEFMLQEQADLISSLDLSKL